MDSLIEKEDFKVKFPRFKTCSSDVKEDIFKARKSQNTNRATRTWVTCFNEYLIEKQLKPEPDLTNDELPQILSDFYVELRKKKVKKIAHKLGKDGKVIPEHAESDDYKNTSLKCIRAALNRHFTATRNLDIIGNDNFVKCNEMFQGVTKKGKHEGRGEIESKPPIEEEDMKRISNYFLRNMKGAANPEKLQEMLLFYIIYYGGRHGHENLRYMMKNTFQMSKDADDRLYIHQVIKEHDKNHTENDFDPSNEARIYKNRDSSICPVKIFNLYTSKLNPNSNCLWQRPKKKVTNSDNIWYDNSPVGRDPLNNAMKNLSTNAALSMIYKNHSICATVVTNLDNKGFEARHIMATTGHKSEVSIKNYSRKCSTRKRREMSDALATSLHQGDEKIQPKRLKKEPVEAQSRNIQDDHRDNNTEEKQPNFNLAMAELDTINTQDLSDIFGIDDPIETPEVLDIVSQIEKENAQIVPVTSVQPTTPPTPKTINVSNVQNVQQKLRNMVPTMHFPHSNVTINYHFHN